MSWEDAIFSAAQVCFSVSLVGMVRATVKPPLWSAAMYAAWVWAITAADIGLALPFATVTAAVGAVLWTLLAVQSARSKNSRLADRLGNTVVQRFTGRLSASGRMPAAEKPADAHGASLKNHGDTDSESRCAFCVKWEVPCHGSSR